VKPIILASAAALAALASPAFAATQGTPGPTSTGTVTINATITPEVNITNLNDFTFDATFLQTRLNTGAPAAKTDLVCVWSNNVDGSYFITATGDGAGNAFTITNGTDAVAYNVDFTPLAQGGPGGALTSGTKSVQLTSPATAPDCGGGTTALLAIVIANPVIAQMKSGTTYTGVLTLLVSPT
jgi:hypothetical protein